MLRGSSQSENPGKELFRMQSKQYRLPELKESKLEDAYDEIELLGFPVSMTAFDLLKTSFRGTTMARNMLMYAGKEIRMVGNLVCIKNVKTVHGEWMHFGTFLDAEGEFFDTIHFPFSLKEYPFIGYGVCLILCRVDDALG